MQRSLTRLARNAFRISISTIYTGATVILSTYSAKAEFITLSDFDNTAVVTDLNNLGVPTPHIFATPLKVGIYMFTTDAVGSMAGSRISVTWMGSGKSLIVKHEDRGKRCPLCLRLRRICLEGCP
jgi:hypothetical protein